MKRTTLILDAGLYRALKRLAADEERTLTEVVERVLRAGLLAIPTGRHARIEVPSYELGPFLIDPAHGDGGAPGAGPGPEEPE